jgi:hypothetical protein
METNNDLLFVDKPFKNQNFVVLSFLIPENFFDSTDKKNNNVRGVKVRGVFKTRKDAEDFIQSFIDDKTNERNCDLYIGEVGKWLPFVDNIEYADDVEYTDKELNKLMSMYAQKKNKDLTKEIDFSKKKENNDSDIPEKKENLDLSDLNHKLPLEAEIQEMRKLLEQL